jgi:hypothetical protein
VGISFVGVDEVFQQEGQSNTTVLATPDYVMKQVDVINCPAITRRVMRALKDVPPTPVYWEPGYVKNWKKFIQAAIVDAWRGWHNRHLTDRQLPLPKTGST